MKTNKGFAPVLILLAVFAVLAIGGGAYYVGTKNASNKENVSDNNYQPQENQNNIVNNSNKTTPTNNLIGGDKDAHGCIGSAGYSWCELKNKCLRIWEEKCESIPVNNKIISQKEAEALALKTWGACDPSEGCVLVVTVGQGNIVTAVHRLGDDSVRFEKRVAPVSYNNGVWVFGSVTITQQCQPGRGHQDFSSAPCI